MQLTCELENERGGARVTGAKSTVEDSDLVALVEDPNIDAAIKG